MTDDRLRVALVVGARPNFVKAAALARELRGREGVILRLIHTGQHFDAEMSGQFFAELDLPSPDVRLDVGSGSNAEQIALTLARMTGALREERPDLVVVVGDVNATLAATLAAQEHRIPVAHVEAGLRSFDRSMPEEVNRVVVDHLADLLFTPSRDADENLLREGVAPERIHLVGNIMIDTLVAQLDAARRLDQAKRLGLAAGGYALVTLHRPANVDAEEPLRALVRVLAWVQERIPIVFPVHPRTRARLEGSGGLAELAALRGVRLLRPLAYREFLSLQATARFVMTDSGGVQEETTFLGVPCLTVRRTTERPITVEEGTNEVVGTDSVRIQSAVEAILEGRWKSGHPPELWDGKTAGRVADVLLGRARPPGGQARG